MQTKNGREQTMTRELDSESRVSFKCWKSAWLEAWVVFIHVLKYIPCLSKAIGRCKGRREAQPLRSQIVRFLACIATFGAVTLKKLRMSFFKSIA